MPRPKVPDSERWVSHSLRLHPIIIEQFEAIAAEQTRRNQLVGHPRITPADVIRSALDEYLVRVGYSESAALGNPPTPVSKR